MSGNLGLAAHSHAPWPWPASCPGSNADAHAGIPGQAAWRRRGGRWPLDEETGHSSVVLQTPDCTCGQIPLPSHPGTCDEDPCAGSLPATLPHQTLQLWDRWRPGEPRATSEAEPVHTRDTLCPLLWRASTRHKESWEPTAWSAPEGQEAWLSLLYTPLPASLPCWGSQQSGLQPGKEQGGVWLANGTCCGPLGCLVQQPQAA